MTANEMAQNTTIMLEHMRIGVAWQEDLATAQALLIRLNSLETQYKLLVQEYDQLKSRLNELWSDGNPLTTAED